MAVHNLLSFLALSKLSLIAIPGNKSIKNCTIQYLYKTIKNRNKYSVYKTIKTCNKHYEVIKTVILTMSVKTMECWKLFQEILTLSVSDYFYKNS